MVVVLVGFMMGLLGLLVGFVSGAYWNAGTGSAIEREEAERSG